MYANLHSGSLALLWIVNGNWASTALRSSHKGAKLLRAPQNLGTVSKTNFREWAFFLQDEPVF